MYVENKLSYSNSKSLFVLFSSLSLIWVIPTEISAQEDFETYSNEKYGFSITYPSEWSKTEESSYESGSSPSPNLSDLDPRPVWRANFIEDLDDEFNNYFMVVVLEPTPTMMEDFNFESYTEDALDGFKFLDFYTIVDSNSTSLGGNHEGYAIRLVNTDDGDVSSLLWTIYNNRIYRLVYDSDQDEYERLLPIFTRMIESFRLDP